MSNNPYKGLRPYSETDVPLFHGRNALMNRMRGYLMDERRLVALSGPAGSGKTSTSIVMAGALRNQCQTIYLSIEDQPLRQTAMALQEMGKNTDLLSRVYSDPEAVATIMGELSATGNAVLLVLDAFENLFARVSVGERVYFLDALYRAITHPNAVCHLCIVIRDDFRDRLMEYPQWAELLDDRMLAIPDMSTTELTDVISLPARTSGITLDPALVDRLLQDVKRLNPSRLLPPLSFALATLYEGGEMTTSGYDHIGVVSGVIAQVAEAVYNSFTAIQQLVARRILLQCIVSAETADPLTRAVERDRMQFNWVGKDDVNFTIGQLIAAGLLTEQHDGVPMLILSHECLTREWPRYAVWIREESESLRYASELEQLASTWVTREYSEQALLRGAALDEALSWMANLDNLPSAILESYISVSSHLRQNQTVQQKRQERTTRFGGWSVAVALLVVTGLLALISFFAVGASSERDMLTTRQAEAVANLATSTAQKAELVTTIRAAQTQQADAQAQIVAGATAQAQAQAALDAAVTQQANVQATAAAVQAVAQSTIEGYAAQVSVNATAMADVNHLQATLDAAIQQQMELRQYLAGQLAQQVPDVLSVNPSLALYLAAEAGTIRLSASTGEPDPLVDTALREALKANIADSLGSNSDQSWFLGANSYAVVRYTDGPAKLWRMNPLEVVTEFPAPIDQIIPVADGKTFIVDYADETTDELWAVDPAAPVAQFSGDIAPPPEKVTDLVSANVVQLQGGAFFTVRFADGHVGELWETATASRKAVLDGDVERVVPLNDGYFFADYAEPNEIGRIWQTSNGQPAQKADDVLTVPFDNGIFGLRREGQPDEIWLTDPFGSIATVQGLLDGARHLNGTDYIMVEYQGEKPAEIWRQTPTMEKVVTMKGQIDLSITYVGGQYFFIRYADLSASELWRTDPLEVAARLNGHLETMDMNMSLGDQVAVVNYADNSISEAWSLPDAHRIAPLTGNMLKAKSILGDTAFVVRYDGNQPSEVWTSAEATRIGVLGEGQKTAVNVIPIKDGAYTVVLYADAPAEIWSVATEGVSLLATLPDVTQQIFLLEGGNYLIANYAARAAQIWDIATLSPISTLLGTVTTYAYDGTNQRLSYATLENQSYTLDFGTLTALLTPDTSTADLLTQTCERLKGTTPPLDEIAPYLGGQTPVACTLPAAP
jgi:hypothetical protein